MAFLAPGLWRSRPRVSGARTADGSGLSVDCVRTPAALQQLETDWMALFERSRHRNVFLSYDWMTEWWARWGDGRRLFVVTVRHPTGRLMALAPFCIAPRAGRVGSRALGFLAATQVSSDHLDILVEPGGEAVAAGAIALHTVRHRQDWDYIELADSDGESPSMAALRRELIGLNMTERVADTGVCPFTALPGSFEQYLARLGPNVRYNFRRRMRALERAGPLKFVVLVGTPIAQHFAELVRLHGLRFGQRGEKSFFLEPAIQAFHSAILTRMAARGWARLYLLQMRDTVIAALYGFSVGKKFVFYQSGMDPAWTRSSVGLVMMGRAIEEAIHSGHEEFDFLRGDEAYKFQWANRDRRLLTVRLFDQRPRSQWALAMLRLSEQADRAKATLRLWIAAGRRLGQPPGRADREHDE